jgi:hypothetical protein
MAAPNTMDSAMAHGACSGRGGIATWRIRGGRGACSGRGGCAVRGCRGGCGYCCRGGIAAWGRVVGRRRACGFRGRARGFQGRGGLHTALNC